MQQAKLKTSVTSSGQRVLSAQRVIGNDMSVLNRERHMLPDSQKPLIHIFVLSIFAVLMEFDRFE